MVRLSKEKVTENVNARVASKGVQWACDSGAIFVEGNVSKVSRLTKPASARGDLMC